MALWLFETHLLIRRVGRTVYSCAMSSQTEISPIGGKAWVGSKVIESEAEAAKRPLS